jgi:hypothetical protein
VDESIAWLNQALADRQAGERERAAANQSGSRVWCRAIAKYQQAVEKAVKAIVSALVEAHVLNVKIGYKHEVQRWVRVLVRLPSTAESRSVQRRLGRLFDTATRDGIRSLELLIPKAPPDGRPRRNTEYPFQGDGGKWAYPAAAAVFSSEEVDRFRALAQRVAEVAGRVVSALRRRPR